MGILERLTKAVRPSTVAPLPLRIDLDQRADGKHVATFWLDLPAGAVPIDDPATFVGYGTTIEVAGRRFRPTLDQVQTIEALRAMGPASGEPGQWVFDVLPSVLTYLRQRQDVEEGAEYGRADAGAL